ncbi:MAG: TolC family protein, partial [Gemmatimonadaceae bacterium]
MFGVLAVLAASPLDGHAQAAEGDVDSLVVLALATNPALHAASARVEAAQARIGPAGTRPDPMLIAGVQNVPVSDPGFDDEMTMKMIGVGQTIPYPGKLGLRRRVAEREVEVARAALLGVSRQVERDVRDVYYELAYLARALEIVERNRDVLVGLIKVTEARYGVGAAGQQDVLRARMEASRLAESAVQLAEQRHAVLARLNGVLDRPSDAAVSRTAIPMRIVRAAVADAAAGVRFVSAALGARAADSPFPPVAELQALALQE